MTEQTKKDLPDVRNVLMGDNDAGAETIGEYLSLLLRGVWQEEQGFNGKRPFGNSGWKHEIYEALVNYGHVDGKIDVYGYVEEIDRAAADELVDEAIRLMGRGVALGASTEYVYSFRTSDGYVSGMEFDSAEKAQQALDSLRRPHDWHLCRRALPIQWEDVK